MNRKKRAFTLVELLIAMAVGFIVIAAAYAIFNQQNKILTQQEKLASVYQNARIGMEMITQDISMAGYNQPASAGVTPVDRCSGTTTTTAECVGIKNAVANEIKICTDLNGNGYTYPGGPADSAGEEVTYKLYYSSGVRSLGRISNNENSSSPAIIQPVVEYIDESDSPTPALIFVYEDSSGATTNDLEKITRVKITIRTRAATPDPDYTDPVFNDHYRRYTLTSYAIPRNLLIATTATSTDTSKTTTTSTATTTAATTTATTTARSTTSTASSSTTSSGSGISNITLDSAGSAIAKNQRVTICTTVSDSDAATVKLITNQDDIIEMTLIDGLYCGTIPKYNNKTVNYYIETYDSSNNVRDTSAAYSYD